MTFGQEGAGAVEEYVWTVCDEVPGDVVLLDPGPEPLHVAQAVRRLTGLSPWRSRTLLDRVPVVVLHGVPEETAEAACAVLHAAGARTEHRRL
ncbi:ribosomal protein L7/L12 [Streptomyces sp. NPDC047130]|uniref:ribosomal protein L7/L12 n=1 Tax=Streptomyces sp. NPDC047130 TaxID=3155261 RepID=UPI0033D2DABF